ncbi:MAG: GNAT family N-acetyltransferase [Deltaproteobacteria bacterium]
MPKPDITYRRAVAADADQAHRMLSDLAASDGGALQGTADGLRKYAFGPREWFRLMLAFGDGQPVGIATYFPEYSSWRCGMGTFIQDLWSEPVARGRGVGRGLIAAVQADAADWDSRFVTLMVHRNNPAAQGFYSRQGFVVREDSEYLILEGAALEALGR